MRNVQQRHVGNSDMRILLRHFSSEYGSAEQRCCKVRMSLETHVGRETPRGQGGSRVERGPSLYCLWLAPNDSGAI